MAPKSRRIQSAAVCKRARSLGTVVEKEVQNQVLQDILAILKKNPTWQVQTLQLLQTGMVEQIMLSGEDEQLPGCCTKLKTLSKNKKAKFLKSALPALDRTTLKSIKGAPGVNYDVVERLFYFALAELPGTPITEHNVDAFTKILTERYDLLGKRLELLKLDLSGAAGINWQESGLYEVVLGIPASPGGEAGPAQIMHKPSGLKAPSIAT